MTDLEFLELAAKAICGEFHSGHFSRDGREWEEWNPLTDDGDALRLAAKLRISIDFNDCCAWSRGVFGLVQEFWGGDYPDCYRNAIVRAAAEIGKEAS